MRTAIGFAIATALVVSSATGALAATRNHSGHRYEAPRQGAVRVLPYDARGAFGAVTAPSYGQDCSQRPFARDCDKRGPW